MLTRTAAATFKDKVVLITGASTGIGEHLALKLAEGGARLVLAARRQGELEKVAEACRARGAQALAVPTDVAQEPACRKLVAAAIERFGRLDVLVHNAGISMWTRFDEVTDLSIFGKVMEVNYLGPVYLTHAALPHLKQSRGLVVAVSSLTGKTGVPTRSGYSASKHALQGFFDSIRIELMDDGVDVCVISPGFVATDIRAKAFSGGGAAREASPRDEYQGNMSVEECVRQMLVAMAGRRREVVMTPKAKVGLWLKLIAPRVVDGIARRAVKERDGGA